MRRRRISLVADLLAGQIATRRDREHHDSMARRTISICVVLFLGVFILEGDRISRASV